MWHKIKNISDVPIQNAAVVFKTHEGEMFGGVWVREPDQDTGRIGYFEGISPRKPEASFKMGVFKTSVFGKFGVISYFEL